MSVVERKEKDLKEVLQLLCLEQLRCSWVNYHNDEDMLLGYTCFWLKGVYALSAGDIQRLMEWISRNGRWTYSVDSDGLRMEYLEENDGI